MQPHVIVAGWLVGLLAGWLAVWLAAQAPSLAYHLKLEGGQNERDGTSTISFSEEVVSSMYEVVSSKE